MELLVHTDLHLFPVFRMYQMASEQEEMHDLFLTGLNGIT